MEMYLVLSSMILLGIFILGMALHAIIQAIKTDNYEK